jgi:hypothetical protein
MTAHMSDLQAPEQISIERQERREELTAKDAK